MRALHAWLLALSMTPTAIAFAAPPCDAPQFREFDFWIGDWQVFKPDGTVAGTNRIEQEYGGCVLHEHYQTAKGYSGESLNTYDLGRKRWHPTSRQSVPGMPGASDQVNRSHSRRKACRSWRRSRVHGSR